MCAKMYNVLKPRFFYLLFLFLLLTVQSSFTLEQLCSNKKSENKCLCKRFTDNDSGLPNTLADCTSLSFTDFPDLTRLRNDVNVLDLSVNKINILDPTNYKVSSQNLRKLILSHNKIYYVDVEFFDELPELQVLDLSYNNISSLEEADIFSKLQKLVYLDLSFNNIKLLPDGIFEPLPHLRYLYISYNALGDYLMQSKEVLTKTLGVSPNLTHLGMDHVGVDYLHNSYFDSYINLKHLTLADNNFSIIPTLPYSVEYLDLSGNNFTYISAKYLNYHSLKTLKLNRMQSLTSIHHYAFYNLQSLEKLVITDCPNLNEFTELAFGIASKTIDLHPKYLSLARNGLQNLNSTYKYLFRKMTHIDVRHNPWNCDCDILWLQEFEHELYKSNHIRCNSPMRLKNKNVMDLSENDLPHCHPEIYGKTSHRVLIVVLMAAVIVLMGLIFYLVRYPSTWLNPKHVGIGPNSPYNRAPTSEA